MNSKWTQLQKKPQKSRKKTVIIVVVTLLVLAGLAFAGYKYLDHRRTAKENAKHAAQEAAQNQQIKEQTADRDKDTNSSSTTDDPATDQSKNAGDVPVLSTDLGVVINRVTHNNAGDPVSVRATVSGTTVGTCTVTFSKSGQADIVKTFDVEYSATAVSCGTADVDEDVFPASGVWNVKVTVTSDGKISAPATTQVTINK